MLFYDLSNFKMKELFFCSLLFVATSHGCRAPLCPDPANPINPDPIVDPVAKCSKITSWKLLSTGITDNLTHIHFTSAQKGYTGGYNGRLFKTTNGGSSFQTLSFGNTEDLNAMFFVNDTIGFIGTNVSSLNIGVSHLYKTTNGGQTFTSINAGASMYYRVLYFLDQNIGFAGGGGFPYSSSLDGKLMKTEDGGTTWVEITITGLKQVTEFFFLNSSLGFACGSYGQIHRTTDGGNTWTNISPTNLNNITAIQNILYTDILFLNSNTGFCVGFSRTFDESFLLKTTDGGNSWTRIYPPSSGLATEDYYGSVIFTDDNTGYITCSNSNAPGTLLTTTDGGNTWAKEASISTTNLNRISKVSCEEIYFSGASGRVFSSLP